MKVHIIQNGSLKLSLTGETELETAVLKQLFSSQVSVQMHEKLQVLDIALTDTVVITPKTAE